jgi:hypothetical protein
VETKQTDFRVEITVNKKPFPWDRKTISGLEVLDLAQESEKEFDVYVKRKGEDDKVAPEQHVDVGKEDNRHFRTVPKEITEG